MIAALLADFNTPVTAGQVIARLCPEQAREQGYTVVDLSDDWVPFLFRTRGVAGDPLAEPSASHAEIENWMRSVMPDLHPIVRRLDELIRETIPELQYAIESRRRARSCRTACRRWGSSCSPRPT